MNRPEMTPEIREIVAKIIVLRNYTRRTGFHTIRTEREILARLGPDDLVAVLIALEGK